MSSRDSSRVPLLDEWFRQHVSDEDKAGFLERVRRRYSIATLERLAQAGRRVTRRAAVLALGYLGNYRSNRVLGRALVDKDRGVRILAEGGIRSLWCRAGTESQRVQLEQIIRLNSAGKYGEAETLAATLIKDAPQFSEAWNQRAVAYFGGGRFIESIHDCRQALKLNPFHFGAAAGMGQCYLRLGDQVAALEAFQKALGLNPDLEGVRANVVYLRRALKRK